MILENSHDLFCVISSFTELKNEARKSREQLSDKDWTRTNLGSRYHYLCFTARK